MLRAYAGYMKQIDALREKKDAEPAAGKDDPEEESHDRTAAGPAKEPAAEKFIYCPFCGRRAAFESRFCTACGTNLTEDDREV